MVLSQIEIEGQLYELVPVKKKRNSSEKDLAAQEKHGKYLKRIVDRNKILYYEKDYKSRMNWQQCMAIASEQIKEEDLI